MSEPADLADRFCPACGYNLRGIASERCPECGQVFDPNQPSDPQIPWSHRRTIGRRKAFWRTVKLVCFNNKQFASEINRPVRLSDALAFRRTVALHLFIPIALLTSWGYLEGLGYLRDWDVRHWFPSEDLVGSISQLLGLPVLLASIWLFLIFAFGVGSYFFHPKALPMRQQNRAVALSYYGCAPWTLLLFSLPIVAGLIVAIAAFDLDSRSRGNPVAMGVVWILLIGVLGVQATLMWITPVYLFVRTTHCSGLRKAVFTVGQPLLLIVAALLTLGAINGLFWGLAFAIVSFT